MVDACVQTVDVEDDCESQMSQNNYTDLENSFVLSEESVNSESDASDDIHLNFSGDESNKNIPLAAIIYWSSLMVFIRRCLTCSSKAFVKKVIERGTALLVTICCIEGHTNVWRSQPYIRKHFHGNINRASSILLSANTFEKIRKHFELASIPFFSKTNFYNLQRRYLFGAVNRWWLNEQKTILHELKQQRECLLSGDGRCDSPGHSAKYLTYTFLDQTSKKIVATTITQCTEAGNSNRMEKYAFIKLHEEMESKGIEITQVTTDRHVQIKKYMREHKGNMRHQFDVWHVCKNLKKKLMRPAKKKVCNVLSKWIKSICNHFWWSCGTCEGNEQLLREKWVSILFHIQNKHEWTGNTLYHQCSHAPLCESQRKKIWLDPRSEAFIELQKIVLDKTLLKDLKNLTQFSHTGDLEVYHSLYNKWVPKSTHFSYEGMVARTQLAVLDFNLGSNLLHAKTDSGEHRYNLSFSKITRNWSAKPIKENKDRTVFKDIAKQVLDAVENNVRFERVPKPDLPANIASVPRPNKDEVIKYQRSRFSIT